MADPESPEAFAERLFGLVASDAAAAIRARDRQVREAALAEAAAVCDAAADDYRNRRTTPKWTAEDAAQRIRALATGAPDDR